MLTALLFAATVVVGPISKPASVPAVPAPRAAAVETAKSAVQDPGFAVWLGQAEPAKLAEPKPAVLGPGSGSSGAQPACTTNPGICENCVNIGRKCCASNGCYWCCL